MLYPEYPIGTGFSYGDHPETEEEAASDLYVFLVHFFEIFPHLSSHKFFVFGESYAGMFVPSVSRYIHQKNLQLLQSSDSAGISRHINLQGAALGNGWMDARVQGPATIDYSWWHGLIDEPTRNALHVEWKNCYDQHLAGSAPFHPFTIQDDCGIMWGILAAAGNPNAYDVTTWDPNVDQVTFASEAFYNTPAVKEILHAPANVTWHGCQGMGRRRRQLKEGHHDASAAHRRRLYMDNDQPLSVVPYVAELLDANIPVLVYNGDRDMTTNMVGTELLLNRMVWKGQDTWLDAPRGLWLLPDELRQPHEQKQAGWAKEHQGLTFVVVYNSGHMVPYNQPAPAGDLLVRFLKNQSFVDQEAVQVRVKSDTKEKHRSHEGYGSYDLSYLTESLALAGSPPPALLTNTHSHHAVTSIVSMLVGAILAFLIMKSRENRRRYEQVY
jgi:pimeloyl-ACP methyl ester carboxylesterase